MIPDIRNSKRLKAIDKQIADYEKQLENARQKRRYYLVVSGLNVLSAASVMSLGKCH